MIEFAPGVQSVLVPVEILVDSFLEGTESFGLTVESAGFVFFAERHLAKQQSL